MKYLKCVLEPPLPHGYHMTFAFFGKEIVSKEMLDQQLEGLKPFKVTLESVEENFGSTQKPLMVTTYSTDTMDCHERRKHILQLAGEVVASMNHFKWNPHVTLSQEKVSFPQEMKVIGIESNDGGYKVLF